MLLGDFLGKLGFPTTVPKAPLVSPATELPFETLKLDPEPFTLRGHKYNIPCIFLVSLYIAQINFFFRLALVFLSILMSFFCGYKS